MENDLFKGAVEYTARRRKESLPINREEFGNVQRGCEVVGLKPSTYYYRSKVASVEDRKAEADLRDRIEQIVVEHVRYGYRRVTCSLSGRDRRLTTSGAKDHAQGKFSVSSVDGEDDDR